MINHKKKFIFLHTPKTGGVTIGQTLYNLLDVDSKYEGFEIHYDKFDENLFKDYFVFTFVRNPWDRFYSLYKFRQFLNKHSLSYAIDNLEDLWVDNYYPQEKIENSKKFLNKLRFNDVDPLTTGKPFFNLFSYMGENIHLASQVNFLKGHFSGNIDRLPYIDFIGRFENLQQDFDFICKKIGLPQTKLQHLNRSNKLDVKYYDVMTDKDINTLQNIFNEDIEMFNYSFK